MFVAVVGGPLAMIQCKAIKNALTRVHLFWSKGYHTNSVNACLKHLLSLKLTLIWGGIGWL